MPQKIITAMICLLFWTLVSANSIGGLPALNSKFYIDNPFTLHYKKSVKYARQLTPFYKAPVLNLTEYLPLSGGTLSGALAGTSASFSGNVGIGTGAPTDALQVMGNIALRDRGTLNTTDYIGRAGSLGNYAAWIGFAVDGTYNNYLSFGTVQSGIGGGERMRIDYNGNVGIGTSSPGAKFTAVSAGSSNLTALIRNEDASNGYGVAIESEGSSATRYALTVRNLSGSQTYLHVSTVAGQAGNVGIGTSSPNAKLSVNGNLSFGERNIANHYIGHTASNNFGSYSAWQSFSTDGSDEWITFGTLKSGIGGGERMRIDPDGNIGIGTSSPGAKLTAVSSGNSNLTALIRNEDASNGYGLAIESEGTSATRYALTVRNLSASQTYLHVSTVAGQVGNVGIGTTSPNAKLSVNGNLSFGERNIANHYIGHTASNNFGGYSAWQSFSTDGADEWITFGTLKSGIGGGERMRIDPNGNVGINTTSPDPSYKLSVNGNIHAKKLVVETGWSDYVFNDDYKLRSLSSLETFIKQNKHLPEVPSAKEVAEKGISVGENQALLLKKIEELTLYVIAQQKEIEILKRKTNKL